MTRESLEAEGRSIYRRHRAYVDGCEAAAAYVAGETDEYQCPYPLDQSALRALWLKGWLDTEETA